MPYSWHPKIKITLKQVIAVLIMLVLLIMGSRVWTAYQRQQTTLTDATPMVNTIRVLANTNNEVLLLPGNIRAWHEAPVYARANGYVKQWYVDIGAHVKQGEVLADIETPELNAQLRQANADLTVIITQHAMAEITKQRWVHLLKTESVSKQATDEAIHAEQALQASVIAARAKRDHLQELVDFEHVVAPFDGIVSLRNTDVGALINAGNPPSATPLFKVVQLNRLRLYINLPEPYAPRIQPHMRLDFSLMEYPGRVFHARLQSTANAIDPNTRTLLTEFVLPNKDLSLLPGSYTQVRLNIPAPQNSVMLPINTLIFREQGLQVATLDAHNQVVLKNIEVGVDLGTSLIVNTGIKPGETLIINPSDAIYSGQQVILAKNHTQEARA